MSPGPTPPLPSRPQAAQCRLVHSQPKACSHCRLLLAPRSPRGRKGPSAPGALVGEGCSQNTLSVLRGAAQQAPEAGRAGAGSPILQMSRGQARQPTPALAQTKSLRHPLGPLVAWQRAPAGAASHDQDQRWDFTLGGQGGRVYPESGSSLSCFCPFEPPPYSCVLERCRPLEPTSRMTQDNPTLIGIQGGRAQKTCREDCWCTGTWGPACPTTDWKDICTKPYFFSRKGESGEPGNLLKRKGIILC